MQCLPAKAALTMYKRRCYSVSELAIELQLDRRTVSAKLADITSDGSTAGHPTFFLSTAVEAIYAGSTSTREEIDKERLLALQSERLEREGRLVDANKTGDVWINIYGRVRTPLLAVPAKLAQILARTSDPAACQELLRKEIYSVLRRIAGVEYAPGMFHEDKEIAK